MKISNKELQTVKSLVGDTITQDDLKFIDCFISDELSMFMPIGGNCGYAITPDHQHPAYMFSLPYDHETIVYVEKEKFQTEPNTIFCLSPEIIHHEVQNYLPPKYCAIFISRDLFEQSFKSYHKELLHFNSLVVGIKNNKLNLLIKNFINESQNIHSSREIILNNIAVLITHEIIRNVIEYDFHETVLTNNLIINEAVKYININFEQDITIEDLAKISNLSKSHFTKLFNGEMNVTPMVYLKTIRLQNAKKMLLANQLTITQISQQCGFNSPAYFTKLFKETFNETPKEFMKR